MSIASSAQIAPGVSLGNHSIVGHFVVIGEQASHGEPAGTSLGANANIRSHTVIYHDVTAGSNFQTGHSALIREFTTIGDDVSIGSHGIIEHHVTIGHRVRIHSGAFIPEYSILEDDCWIGPRVVLTNAHHPRCVNMPKCLQGVTVGRNAKIGANVTILPGVIIGENSLVGAGSVVTKNVEPDSVVIGSPAKKFCGIHDLVCPYDNKTIPYSILTNPKENITS